MHKIVFKTTNLSKSFKKKQVLFDINLEIPKSKVYGLLGVNGSGKSTLMKIMTGIITDYTGNMFFENNDWSRNDLKRIGALIEYPALYGNLNALENLKIACLEEGIDLDKRDSVLQMLKISDTGNKKVSQFSLGMKQRLGIAMALLKEPSLLILDEPFNGLDPYGIKELKEFIKDMSSKGVTILVSSHILSDIQDIADVVGIINEGKLVYQKEYLDTENLEEIFFKETQGRV